MSNALRKLDQNAERWLLLVFYTMLVVTMFIEVLRREVLSYSSIWGEEIVRYSFIYLAWIGAAAAVRQRGHIRIDVLMQYVGPRVKAALYLFGDAVMFGVALIAFYWSFETVLVSEKERYEAEGVGWMGVQMPSTEACLNLVQGKPYGIMSLLDEQVNHQRRTPMPPLSAP